MVFTMNHRILTLLRMAIPALLACATLPAIAAAPTVTTNAATGVTDSGATLNATVNDNGKSTSVSFEAGGSTAYGSTLTATTGATVSAGMGNTAAAVSLTGLACNTTYNFRAKGVNGDGTTLGGNLSFTTTACVGGACGSDNGLTLTATPANLCTSGIASGVASNTTGYTWSCDGGIGWGAVSCLATRHYAVTSSVSGSGNGTISASQNVAYNATSSFTLTPATGYFSAPLTGTCGGTLSGNTTPTGSTFATNPVTASCTVIANFVAIAVRDAFFVNASSSGNKTSVVRLVNVTGQSAALTATAYDGAGTVVGTANASLGTFAAQQTLAFTSAQLESAIGYTPSAGTAKYRIAFSAKLTNFEVINFTKDVATGNLTLAQAQIGNRAVSTASSSVRNMFIENPSTNLSRTSVARLINTSSQSGQVTATAFSENGDVLGTLNASLGAIAPQQVLSFTSAQLESALGYFPSSSSARYRLSFGANLPGFELINFIKDTATGNVALAQAQIDDRAASATNPSVRNALYVNASSNAQATSMVHLINPDVSGGSVTATAYNETGSIVGTANAALGAIGGQRMLTFTSAQLEAAIGYVPASGSAKHRIVFQATLPNFELVNFMVDAANGNLTLGQAQVDNRVAGTAASSTRQALFLNASNSTNKTSVVHLINLTAQSGTVTATAYDEGGSIVGHANTVVGTLAGQQTLTFTSAQLESALGFVPSAPTAKHRVVFSANLPSFEVVNFVVSVATGGLTLGQGQID